MLMFYLIILYFAKYFITYTFEFEFSCTETKTVLPTCLEHGWNYVGWPNPFEESINAFELTDFNFSKSIKNTCDLNVKNFLCFMAGPPCSNQLIDYLNENTWNLGIFDIPDNLKPYRPCKKWCARIKNDCIHEKSSIYNRINCLSLSDDYCINEDEKDDSGIFDITKYGEQCTNSDEKIKVKIPGNRNNHDGFFCSRKCDEHLLKYPFTSRLTFKVIITIFSCLAIISSILGICCWITNKTLTYPIYSLVNISLCHGCIAFSYLIRFFVSHNDAVCIFVPPNLIIHDKPDYIDNTNNLIYNDLEVAHLGSNHICSIVFGISYGFQISSCSWWLVFCITWFLTTNKKWAREAIDSHKLLYYIIGWIPSIILTIICIFKVPLSSHDLSGFCEILPIKHNIMAFIFINFIPSLLPFAIGLIIFVFGVISANSIKNSLKLSPSSIIVHQKFLRFVHKHSFFAAFYSLYFILTWSVDIWRLYYIDYHSTANNYQMSELTLITIKHCLICSISSFCLLWLMNKKIAKRWVFNFKKLFKCLPISMSDYDTHLKVQYVNFEKSNPNFNNQMNSNINPCIPAPNMDKYNLNHIQKTTIPPFSYQPYLNNDKSNFQMNYTESPIQRQNIPHEYNRVTPSYLNKSNTSSPLII